jgi:hypothetical protein
MAEHGRLARTTKAIAAAASRQARTHGRQSESGPRVIGLTTERYLGVRQDLHDAPCDYLKLDLAAAEE